MAARPRKLRLTAEGSRCADHATPLYKQMLALNVTDQSGSSVSTVLSPTKCYEDLKGTWRFLRFHFFVVNFLTINFIRMTIPKSVSASQGIRWSSITKISQANKRCHFGNSSEHKSLDVNGGGTRPAPSWSDYRWEWPQLFAAYTVDSLEDCVLLTGPC
jgi:hypothetical protein